MILIGRGLNLRKEARRGSEEKKLVLKDSRLCSCEGVKKAGARSGSEERKLGSAGHIPKGFR